MTDFTLVAAIRYRSAALVFRRDVCGLVHGKGVCVTKTKVRKAILEMDLWLRAYGQWWRCVGGVGGKYPVVSNAHFRSPTPTQMRRLAAMLTKAADKIDKGIVSRSSTRNVKRGKQG